MAKLQLLCNGSVENHYFVTSQVTMVSLCILVQNYRNIQHIVKNGFHWLNCLSFYIYIVEIEKKNSFKISGWIFTTTDTVTLRSFSKVPILNTTCIGNYSTCFSKAYNNFFGEWEKISLFSLLRFYDQISSICITINLMNHISE